MATPDPSHLVTRYEHLIRAGVYSNGAGHGGPDQRFVRSVMTPVLAAMGARRLRILECGCGPGQWLDEIGALAGEVSGEPADLTGFDVTPGMVDLASQRFAGRTPPVRVFAGDVLDPVSYRAADAGAAASPGYDVVVAFDVVQQLPRERQLEAVELMAGAVRAGGALLVFDHDSRSKFGRWMGTKKWLRRHARLPLVPEWYIHAAYPPLAEFARRLNGRDQTFAQVVTVPPAHRAALVVRP